MKRIILCCISLAAIFITTIDLTNGFDIDEVRNERAKERFHREILSKPENFDLADTSVTNYINGNSTKHHVVTATVYQPDSTQCWGNPLITADGSEIDMIKLEAGELRWCAVSQDLREKFPFGTKLIVNIGDKKLKYIVHDTMNSRYKNYIDLLVPLSASLGKWNNVLIEKEI